MKINELLKNFYPKLNFSKAGLFKLNKEFVRKGTHIMLFLLKPLEKSNNVLATELYFNGKKIVQIGCRDYPPEYLEGVFREIKHASLKYKILKFKKTEKVSTQENKIIKAFEKLKE